MRYLIIRMRPKRRSVSIKWAHHLPVMLFRRPCGFHFRWMRHLHRSKLSRAGPHLPVEIIRPRFGHVCHVGHVLGSVMVLVMLGGSTPRVLELTLVYIVEVVLMVSLWCVVKFVRPSFALLLLELFYSRLQGEARRK